MHNSNTFLQYEHILNNIIFKFVQLKLPTTLAYSIQYKLGNSLNDLS